MTKPLTPDGLRVLEAQLGRAALFAVGTLLGAATIQRLGEPWATWYVPVVVGWALLNGAYLAWHFLGRRDQRVVERILADAYEPARPTRDQAETA